MRVGRLRFAPRPGISILALMVMAALAALGNWQLDRAGEKRAILELYEARSRAPAGPIQFSAADPSTLRYRHVYAYGEFDAARQFLLDNQVRDGRPGYQVLTPLRIPGRREAVLVDRGWVPLAGRRDEPPAIGLLVTGPRRIEGTLYLPYGEGLRLGSIDAGAHGWPRVIQYLDFEALEERLGYPLARFTLRLDPGQPDGFRRDWPTVALTPERHLAYAVQWFALAAVVFTLFVVLNTRRVDPS